MISSRSWLRLLGRQTLLALALLVLVLPGSAAAYPIADDDTPPIVSYTVDGIVGTNGWYRGSSGGDYIVLRWTVSDPNSTITSTSGCEPAIRIDGPNTGTTKTCSATSDGGTTTVTTKTLKIDADPPTGVSPSARATDANGWYNHAVTITWGGSDVTSGIASCDVVTYSGPDSGSVSRSGTCTDKAGNASASVPFGFKYDATAPVSVAASAARGPDHAGWYNRPVALSWTGADAMSGIASCTSLTYSGPDSGSAQVNGSCRDSAGNVSGSVGLSFEYDDTAPSVSGAPSRAADSDGWYNHPLTMGWNGSDATSGIASCSAPSSYGGPDTGFATRSGSCTDNAGNTSTASVSFRYDATPPTSGPAAGRPADANGWYNHPLTVSWNWSDATSGLASCTAPVSYSGPDTSGTSVSGTCTDDAGNSTSAVFPFKYDSIPPAGVTANPGRSPDSNGWYNHPLTIAWSGSDATSGIASCTALTYRAPDTASASTAGSCVDDAGNVSDSVPFGFEYDATPPSTTVSAARAPDHDGWYNHPVEISWSGTDDTSGIASCSPSIHYSGPDSASASSVGGCTDKAGNSSSAALVLRYDATPPVTTVTPARRPDAGGWYNHPVALTWSGSDPVSGIASCTSLTYAGPDTRNAAPKGSCTDGAGNTASVSYPLEFDDTAPTVTAVSAARAPDHAGWYNRPVGVTWTGADATAGIASCTSLTYGGPDNGSAELSGACVDRAGNVSKPLQFGLRYDQTPPVLRSLALLALDHRVVLTWRATGADEVRITRSPGTKGADSSAVLSGNASRFADRKVRNFVRYRYTVTALDAAGNSVARSAAGMPTPPLFSPRPAARVRPHARVLFGWVLVPGAPYYNLQLWRNGQRVGAWWPGSPPFRLPARWRFEGRQRRLDAGRYTWYVWPGLGPRRLGRYGRLLGHSSFVVGG